MGMYPGENSFRAVWAAICKLSKKIENASSGAFSSVTQTLTGFTHSDGQSPANVVNVRTTPLYTTSGTAPSGPRIGDVWVAPDGLREWTGTQWIYTSPVDSDSTFTFSAADPTATDVPDNSTHFNTDTKVLWKFDGTVWAPVTDKHEDGNILWVSTKGDDATAQKGNMHRPYGTLKAGIEAAFPGETVKIMSGVYNPAQAITWKDNVILDFSANVTVNTTGLTSSTLFFAQGDTFLYGKPVIKNDNLDDSKAFYARPVNDKSNINIILKDVRLTNFVGNNGGSRISHYLDISGSFFSDVGKVSIDTVFDDPKISSEKSLYAFKMNNITLKSLTSARNLGFIQFRAGTDNSQINIECTNSYLETNTNSIKNNYGFFVDGHGGATSFQNTKINVEIVSTRILHGNFETAASTDFDYSNRSGGRALASFASNRGNDTKSVQNCEINFNIKNSEIFCGLICYNGSYSNYNNNLISFNVQNCKFTNFSPLLIFGSKSASANQRLHVNFDNVDLTGVLDNSSLLINVGMELQVTLEGKVLTRSDKPFISSSTGNIHQKNLSVIFDDPTQTTALVVDNTSANPINVYCQSVSTNTLQDDPTVTEKLEPILRDVNLK